MIKTHFEFKNWSISLFNNGFILFLGKNCDKFKRFHLFPRYCGLFFTKLGEPIKEKIFWHFPYKDKKNDER